jgi:galactokinase
MVEAVRRVPGCHGARLVGAGFGGSVVALIEKEAAGPCAAALAAVSGMRGAAWLVRPAAGLEVTAADVFAKADARS